MRVFQNKGQEVFVKICFLRLKTCNKLVQKNKNRGHTIDHLTFVILVFEL